MDSETDRMRNIILPIVHATQQDEGQLKYEKLLGTGFMVNRFPRIGLTASSIL